MHYILKNESLAPRSRYRTLPSNLMMQNVNKIICQIKHVLYPSTLTYIKFSSGSILFIGQLRNITYELFFVMRIIGDKPALSLIEALPFTAIEM